MIRLARSCAMPWFTGLTCSIVYTMNEFAQNIRVKRDLGHPYRTKPMAFSATDRRPEVELNGRRRLSSGICDSQSWLCFSLLLLFAIDRSHACP